MQYFKIWFLLYFWSNKCSLDEHKRLLLETLQNPTECYCTFYIYIYSLTFFSGSSSQAPLHFPVTPWPCRCVSPAGWCRDPHLPQRSRAHRRLHRARLNPAPGRKNPNLCCALNTRPCQTASEHTPHAAHTRTERLLLMNRNLLLLTGMFMITHILMSILTYGNTHVHLRSCPLIPLHTYSYILRDTSHNPPQAHALTPSVEVHYVAADVYWCVSVFVNAHTCIIVCVTPGLLVGWITF